MVENINIDEKLSKQEKYELLIPQLSALIGEEKDLIANTANVSAALKEAFGFFWVGFYFVRKSGSNEQLVLGPFQGPVACIRIDKGRGVCGTAWEKKQTIIVDNVELFPGHISCNALSRSEIVIPLLKGNEVFAVLDVDSTRYSNFDATDGIYLNEIASLISDNL